MALTALQIFYIVLGVVGGVALLALLGVAGKKVYNSNKKKVMQILPYLI